MSHFEIAVTVYSVLSTIGLGLTVYYGRKLIVRVEDSIKGSIVDATVFLHGKVGMESTCVLGGIGRFHDAAQERLKATEEGLKADISRVERWITDHAEELKARAEDLRVRALDLHDKTNAGPTRQPPIR